jgi:hypothetical protein
MRLTAHPLIFLLFFAALIYIEVDADASPYLSTPEAVKSTNFKFLIDGHDIPVESFLDVDVARFKLTGSAEMRLFSKHGLAGLTLLPDYQPYIHRKVEKVNMTGHNLEPTLLIYLHGPTKLVVTIPGTRQLFVLADPPMSNEPKPGDHG